MERLTENNWNSSWYSFHRHWARGISSQSDGKKVKSRESEVIVKRKWIPQVGDTVKLRKGLDPEGQTAKIARLYPDITDGVKLESRLADFWSWNIEDLVLVRKTTKDGDK